MIHKTLFASQSYGEGTDTVNFDAKKRQKRGKKEATESDAKRKSDAISTYRHLYLRQKDLRETHNYGLGVG